MKLWSVAFEESVASFVADTSPVPDRYFRKASQVCVPPTPSQPYGERLESVERNRLGVAWP